MMIQPSVNSNKERGKIALLTGVIVVALAALVYWISRSRSASGTAPANGEVKQMLPHMRSRKASSMPSDAGR